MTNRTIPPDDAATLTRIAEAVRSRRRFLITSHLRPDGDSIGSQLAMAWALRHLGKEVRVVNRDAPPPALQDLPGVGGIEIADRTDGDWDAVFVMECSDLARTGLADLDSGFVINLDHHPGNTRFGALNWYDATAAACGEMVADVIDTLSVPLSVEMGTHLYLAILTDTGGFHYANVTARTFELCRRCVAAGVDAVAMARQVYDQNSVGKLRLIGALLETMRLEADDRIAVLEMTDETLRATGATVHDSEGVINLPFTARPVRAVAFFKALGPDPELRVSLRSKGDLDVRHVAERYGGGGHKNAAGFTVAAPPRDLRSRVMQDLVDMLTRAGGG